MIPLTTMDVAFGLVTYILEIISLKSERFKLYDTTHSWELLSEYHSHFEIFDIPFSSGKPAKPLLAGVDYGAGNMNDLVDDINDLPTQEEDTVRVYFEENMPSSIQEAVTRRSPTFFISTGISAMISQWKSHTKSTHWEMHSYSLSLGPTLKHAIRRGRSDYIDSVSIAAGTIRRALKCMIISTEDRRIIFHINTTSMIQRLELLFDPAHLREHQAIRPSRQAIYNYHIDFCESLRRSIGAYSTLRTQISSVAGLKQLLLLGYSHVLVGEYSGLVYRLQNDYARLKEGLSDPRRASLTVPMLAEITRDACFYEEISERANELAGAVDALVETLNINLKNDLTFQSIAVELQSTCTDLKRTLTTLLSNLESHLRLFELSRGIHEAQNVRLLSILASIFLPLSLACGMLSMQTRFANLHYLLYDFFGVLVLLGTIVIILLFVLRLHIWCKNLLAQLDRNKVFRESIKPTGRIMFFFFLLAGWAVLLSSFLVGMIKDVGLGLKILGFGATAIAGPVLLILVFLACASIGIWLLLRE